MDGGAWWAAVHGVAKSRTRLRDFTFTFHFHALATHSSVLAWRIPGTGEPSGLPSMGSQSPTRSNLASARYFVNINRPILELVYIPFLSYGLWLFSYWSSITQRSNLSLYKKIATMYKKIATMSPLKTCLIVKGNILITKYHSFDNSVKCCCSFRVLPSSLFQIDEGLLGLWLSSRC